MQTSIVTSCSQAGWDEVGAKCVASIHQYWPLEVALHVVSEDALPFDPSHYPGRDVRFWNLLDANVNAAAFYARHKDNERAQGRSHPKGQQPRAKNKGYGFRYDAYKFSKKVFAIETVAWEQRKGRLIWLDADTVTFINVPMSLITRLPPTGHALAYLARPGYHSECGFIGYDLDHPQALKFICDFAGLYASDKVFELKEWHDSWVFDHLVKASQVSAFPIPHKSTSHPFVFSELGRYMDHKKGDRKRFECSPEHPILKRGKVVA